MCLILCFKIGSCYIDFKGDLRWNETVKWIAAAWITACLCRNLGEIMTTQTSDEASDSKSLELKIFLFLTVLLAPILSVLLVSGLGFAIWFSQILTGPPGAG